jgi:hypothetical protein
MGINWKIWKLSNKLVAEPRSKLVPTGRERVRRQIEFLAVDLRDLANAFFRFSRRVAYMAYWLLADLWCLETALVLLALGIFAIAVLL